MPACPALVHTTQARVEQAQEAVLAANRSGRQQQPKPDLNSYEELVSSARFVEKDGMPTRMRSHAARAAAKEISRYQGSPDELARRVAQRFDDEYGPSWECVVASTQDVEETLGGAWSNSSKESSKETEQHSTNMLFVFLVVGQWYVVLFRRSGEYDEGEGEYDEGEEYDESA